MFKMEATDVQNTEITDLGSKDNICDTEHCDSDQHDMTSDTDEATMQDDHIGSAEGTKHRLSKTEKKRKRYEERVEYQRQQRKYLKTQRKLNKAAEHETASDLTNEGDSENKDGEDSAVTQTDNDSTKQDTSQGLTKKQKLREIKEKLRQAKLNGQRICVDLSLEGHMSHKECSRLAQQLCRLYGSNRASKNPAHVYFTGLNKSGHLYKECVRKNEGFDNYIIDMSEESHLSVFKPKEIVYLTPDSANTLETIDKDKVYVLGGLVDESVTKNITRSLADEAKISTAKLPIDQYMMKTHKAHSKVLSVNQVFDIILTFLETSDWRKALVVGVPPRKGYRLKDL